MVRTHVLPLYCATLALHQGLPRQACKATMEALCQISSLAMQNRAHKPDCNAAAEHLVVSNLQPHGVLGAPAIASAAELEFMSALSNLQGFASWL